MRSVVRTLILLALLAPAPLLGGVSREDVEAMREALSEAQDADRTGDAGQARVHRERAVSIARSRLAGTIHEANAVDALAFADLQSGRNETAIDAYRESLDMYRRLLHGDQPRVATSLHNLAVAESRIGRSADAEAHALEALSLWDRLPAARAVGRDDTLRLLAKLARTDGRTEDAARYEAGVAAGTF